MGKIGSFVVLMIFCILFSSMASSVLGETMYCWIRNPYGNIVASDSMSITNCGGSTIDPTSGNCEATCDISTTSACCNISDVWYTWEVYDNPPNICCGGGTCGGEACVDNSAASQTGNAYYVDWGIQTYCTDLCIGKPVGWDLPGYAGECCGDGANEYGIPCLDSGEGYCNTPSTDDEKACCVGTTAGSDCVKDGTCYTVNSQFGEWQCIADPANTWHDIVDPVFDSYSISGCQHEDLSVPLNPVCWVGSGITTQHTIRHTDQGSTPDTQYITFTKDGCVPNTCGCPSTTPPGTFCENETKSWVRIDTGAFVDWMVNDSALDIQQPSCTESGGCTGTAAKEEWPVVSGTDDGEYKIWTFLYDQASNAVGYNYVNWWLGIDNTPPNTGISRSGTLGWNDWYTSNVDVTLTCDDGSGSGCESATMHPVIHYCYSQDPVTPCPTYQISSVDSVTFTISDEGHNYLRYYSEDNVGNTQSEVMIEIKIDKTDPTFNAYDILMGCDYWNESVPSDKICWVKQGTTTTHSITHSDAVSTPSLQYITFTKDGCTPNEGCNPDYPTSFSGREIKSWIDVDTGVLIEWMINDSHLDIAAAGCSIPLPTGCTGNTVIIDWLVTAGSLDGEFKVWTFLHDEAGKGIGYTEVDWWLNVDNTPPATNQILAGTMGLENWYRSNVAVALQCDDGSGSGCSQTKYCVDQINSCVPGTVYTGQFTITAEGINYLRFNSTDNVGNVETTNSVQVKIDKTPPNIWINTLPQWTNTSSFLVSWDNSTDTSEIASFQLQWKEEGGVWTDWVTGEISGAATPGSATFGEAPPGNDPDGLIDTETYFLRINATDKAGNTCDWYEVNTTIDLTLPVCIMDPLPDYSPEVFQISWTGDDFGGSGIDFYNVQYNPNGFGWINAFNVTQEGLTASYSFEDGDGKIAADSSGNGYDGTVYGNTKLLMHLDENGTGAGYDESPYDSTVLLMHLDEGSGLTAGDDSRYRNDGTINGATWGTSGCQSGACLEFGGVNNWIDVPTTIADNADGTVSLWVYIDSSESDDAFIWITSNDGCGTGYKFLKYTSSSSRISATYYDGSFKTIVSDTVIDKDRWHHLTYSWGSAGQRLYQDGELVAVNTDNTGQGFAALDHFIGGWGDCSGAGSQYFLDGKIDEVAVHDRALSMSEIRDRYAEGRARLAPKQGRIYGNTRLLMRFDEDKGAATWDESSYGNIGTIYGNTKLLMHLDEGSGNPMDSSPYGNDGTNNGATWQTSGCQSGSCLEFNGNDYVDAEY